MVCHKILRLALSCLRLNKFTRAKTSHPVVLITTKIPQELLKGLNKVGNLAIRLGIPYNPNMCCTLKIAFTIIPNTCT